MAPSSFLQLPTAPGHNPEAAEQQLLCGAVGSAATKRLLKKFAVALTATEHSCGQVCHSDRLLSIVARNLDWGKSMGCHSLSACELATQPKTAADPLAVNRAQLS